VEMIAFYGGYDGIWLDQEHGGLSTEQLEHAARAARGRGNTPARPAPPNAIK